MNIDSWILKYGTSEDKANTIANLALQAGILDDDVDILRDSIQKCIDENIYFNMCIIYSSYFTRRIISRDELPYVMGYLPLDINAYYGDNDDKPKLIELRTLGPRGLPGSIVSDKCFIEDPDSILYGIRYVEPKYRQRSQYFLSNDFGLSGLNRISGFENPLVTVMIALRLGYSKAEIKERFLTNWLDNYFSRQYVRNELLAEPYRVKIQNKLYDLFDIK